MFNNADILNADLQQPESDVAEAHNLWQYYTVTNCKIVCFIPKNEDCIALNVANSSSFGHMIEESVEFAKQNLLPSYKTSSGMRRSFSCQVTHWL